jgi:7-carboxy-7-deazaguanine synthase
VAYNLERLARAKAARAADLVEVFSAIQGEGPRVGQRHLFVRVAHCDMDCVYCDTPKCHVEQPHWRLEEAAGARRFARRPNPEPLDSLGAIVEGLLSGPCPHAAVSFTGGEPLLQPDVIEALAPIARRLSVKALLETDGNLPDVYARVRPLVDVLSMDWKLRSATGEPTRKEEHRAMLRASVGSETYVKAVYVETTPLDEILEAAEVVAAERPDVPLILQPCSPFGGVKSAPSPETALKFQEAALRVHRDVRVVPQVHRLMGQI